MIDKVEVRLPACAEYSKEFRQLYMDLARLPARSPVRPSPHYLAVIDLRAHGYSAMLHAHCTRDKQGNHKLELIDTGAMTYARMRYEIERVFNVNANRLGLMRLDLAADIEGVPVSWFVQHARARWKQWTCDIGEVNYAQMGYRTVQTFYLGRRPNCYRIYDKIAEYKYQYAKLRRTIADGAELPSFQQLFGYPPSGMTLTRVERQLAGGRLPRPVQTFGELKRLPEFNPFANLKLRTVANGGLPDIASVGLAEYGFGMWLRQQAEELGIHRLRSFLNEHSPGHASRLLRRYSQFLPHDIGIDERQLFCRYQLSIRKQFADKPTGRLDLPSLVPETAVTKQLKEGRDA